MIEKENALLEPKLVNDIKGDFFIPSYQRGYRWEREHILMLLNDISPLVIIKAYKTSS